MFVVARGCAAWCVSVESPKICPVCAKDASRNTIWSCHMELVVVVSWICILAAYWHLTNMFSSHGARHTPHRHVRTQLFRSSIRICQRWCCVRADVQPGVCAHHAFLVCVFIHRGTYFRQYFRIVTVQHYSLGYRAVCCWQGVHFFMFVSVEPASSMHTHKSDIQLRAHHRKSCETRDG